jgi:hypothetical protein
MKARPVRSSMSAEALYASHAGLATARRLLERLWLKPLADRQRGSEEVSAAALMRSAVAASAPPSTAPLS